MSEASASTSEKHQLRDRNTELTSQAKRIKLPASSDTSADFRAGPLENASAQTSPSTGYRAVDGSTSASADAGSSAGAGKTGEEARGEAWSALDLLATVCYTSTTATEDAANVFGVSYGARLRSTSDQSGPTLYPANGRWLESPWPPLWAGVAPDFAPVDCQRSDIPTGFSYKAIREAGVLSEGGSFTLYPASVFCPSEE